MFHAHNGIERISIKGYVTDMKPFFATCNTHVYYNSTLYGVNGHQASNNVSFEPIASVLTCENGEVSPPSLPASGRLEHVNRLIYLDYGLYNAGKHKVSTGGNASGLHSEKGLVWSHYTGFER